VPSGIAAVIAIIDLSFVGLGPGFAGGDVEGRVAVVSGGVALRRLVAFTLLRKYVEQRGPAEFFHPFQRAHERADIVAVNGADVAEAEFLEQDPGRQ
jgi:hypothetical protein